MSKHNDGMYTGTPCDECGGPTLGFPSGSIWCPAEDPHPGGHFVVRVAFDRKPKDLAEAQARASEDRVKRNWRQPMIDAAAPKVSKPKPAKVEDPYAIGIDAFVRSE